MVIVKKAESRMRKRKLWQADRKSFLEGLKAAREMVNTDPAGTNLPLFRKNYFCIRSHLAQHIFMEFIGLLLF